MANPPESTLLDLRIWIFYIMFTHRYQLSMKEKSQNEESLRLANCSEQMISVPHKEITFSPENWRAHNGATWGVFVILIK